MAKLTFQDHTIDPVSYTNSDMPGHWFPRAEVITPGGEAKLVSLPPARGVTKEQADAEAVNVAKHRITYNNL